VRIPKRAGGGAITFGPLGDLVAPSLRGLRVVELVQQARPQ
jgi:hypothetical protein